MKTAYRIAGRMSDKDLTRVEVASQFARSIHRVIEQTGPRKLIETGTYLGTGTTAVIAMALRDLGLDDVAMFCSIEVNPKNAVRAKQNLAKMGLNVEILNGLSVPRCCCLRCSKSSKASFEMSLPINSSLITKKLIGPSSISMRRISRPCPTTCLARSCRTFDDRPDFVLLDSGGHMGFVEFRYLIDTLRGPCVIALDDVGHVKHFRSFETIRRDERFEVLAQSDEKFGFCIAIRSRPARVNR